MADVARIIARMQGQIAEDRRRQANMIRSGRVVDVDPANQRVKVDIGDDDNALPTPWIRWTERAGARKTWNPPSKGELMTVLSPAGEIDEKSLAVHGGFTDENTAPSGNGDTAVFTLGSVTVTVIAGGATIQVDGVSVEITGSGETMQVGGVSVEITKSGMAITGGTVTHNGINIGSTHKHGGIRPGPAQTGTPL